MSKFIGIDFSGAKLAGKKIWIAEAEAIANGVRITSLERADRKLSVSPAREATLPALVKYISEQRGAVIGIDFPFSVPEAALHVRPWAEFALQTERRFADQDELREWCWRQAANREVRRETERVADTPFSAYNRWIKFQTYYGITQVIAPLLRAEAAVFPPMQGTSDELPAVIETCPASTLASLGISPTKYKGTDTERAERRAAIIESLSRPSMIEMPAGTTQLAQDDSDGDALDAVIAALAARRSANQIASGAITLHGHIDEGHVFV